jgi:peptidoglycan/LPS O-acetylase OafA/YrhL/lysophospholipase L1-like esterase
VTGGIRSVRAEEAGHRRRLDIQGLRAVAVLLVVADHVAGHPAGGFAGVDVFFVISGFLITGLLLRERETTGRISIPRFYARRVKRIIPAAVTVLLITDVLARYLFVGARIHQTLVDSLWSLGFAANIHLARIGTDYFAAGTPQSPLQHFWSLAVEEQFYVFWPTLLIVVTALARRVRSPRPLVAGLAGLLVLTSFGWCQYMTATNPAGAYFSSLARGWELGIGALLAVVAPEIRRLPGQVRAAAGWTGLVLIGLGAVLLGPATPFPGTAALFPVLGSALVLATGDAPGGVGVRWALGSRPLVYVGTVSYSLYLWHWPVVIYARALVGNDSVGYYLLACGASAALAVASFHLIEEPLRRLTWAPGRAERQRTGMPWWVGYRYPLSAALALAVTVAGIAWASAGTRPAPVASTRGLSVGVSAAGMPATAAGGWASVGSLQDELRAALLRPDLPQLSPPLGDLATSAAAPEWIADHCLDQDTPAQVAHCRYGPPHPMRTAVVVGDSFAVSYIPGIRAGLEPAGYAVQLLTRGQCPNTLVLTDFENLKRNDDCPKHHAFVEQQLQTLHPDLLILSDSAGFIDLMHDGAGMSDAAKVRAWQQGVQRWIAEIRPYAGRVVVLGSPPRLGNLQQCVTATSKASDCVTAPAQTWRNSRAAEAAAAQAVGVPYLDVGPWFCWQDRCPAFVDTTPITWDGDHLTAAFSARLGPLLAQQLPPPVDLAGPTPANGPRTGTSSPPAIPGGRSPSPTPATRHPSAGVPEAYVDRPELLGRRLQDA